MTPFLVLFKACNLTYWGPEAAKRYPRTPEDLI